MESNILAIRDWNWKIRINVIKSSREKRVVLIALFRFCRRKKKKEKERRGKKFLIFKFSKLNAVSRHISFFFRGENESKNELKEDLPPPLSLSPVFFRGMDELDVEIIGNRGRNERRGRVGLTRASCTRDIIFASCDRKSGKWIFSLNEIVWRASATSV